MQLITHDRGLKAVGSEFFGKITRVNDKAVFGSKQFIMSRGYN